MKTIVLIYKRVVFPVQTACLSVALLLSAWVCRCARSPALTSRQASQQPDTHCLKPKRALTLSNTPFQPGKTVYSVGTALPQPCLPDRSSPSTVPQRSNRMRVRDWYKKQQDKQDGFRSTGKTCIGIIGMQQCCQCGSDDSKNKSKLPKRDE